MRGAKRPARPTLRWERSLLEQGRVTVIGCDEVGRGAIAGPVAVGVAAVTIAVGRMPSGLADSKLLSPAKREALVPRLEAWATTAVGMASADLVDEQGIVTALGVAGARGIDQLVAAGIALDGAVVVLDGSFDWLSRALRDPVDVLVRVKADRDCASVAAASVVAKVRRDALMVAAHEEAPHYAWASNKGYGSTEHYDGIRAAGPHALHRRSWLHRCDPVVEVEPLFELDEDVPSGDDAVPSAHDAVPSVDDGVRPLVGADPERS
ncbi:ribonuclease HII [Curtobacterium sp. MCBD17_034]|nr:ribonuclease HII [Curtobacterium sp. MCBD17_034]PZF65429.1 ribonuclease HII [Curtobacterium sp. MCBD17_013]PZM33715.1 ribonuclease HII [Curtobacterium sp. MCBD17_031]